MRFALSAVCAAMLLVIAGPARSKDSPVPPAPHKVQPRTAPAVYVTGNYALTLRTPRASTYCPLPDSWVGSDHGSSFFLTPPAWCAGAGYPSSSRGFGPERTPRIEIYYGYWDEDMPRPPRCRSLGTVSFLGVPHQLCPRHTEGLSVVEVTGLYKAGPQAEAVLTLVTTGDRLARDLKTFREVAATVRSCTSTVRAGQRKTRFGSGAPCPRGQWF
jgi:hypothetical protein